MTALVARHLLHRDRDYLVRAGKVLIIDENTGRSAMGRAWSQGLHQIVEIKEGCPPSAPTAPVAQITYQRFFPRYLRLCGMSGTLMESRGELLGALRAIFRRFALTFRLHAAVDFFRDLLRKINATNAGVDNGDAEFACFLIGLLANFHHQLGAFVAHDLLLIGFTKHTTHR